MTVSIHATQGGDIVAHAEAILQNEIGGRVYPDALRKLAVEAICWYRPAYVAVNSDETVLDVVKLAMSDDRGSLRAVYRGMPHLVWTAKYIKPINAMAQLDQELLMTERALTKEDVCNV